MEYQCYDYSASFKIIGRTVGLTAPLVALSIVDDPTFLLEVATNFAVGEAKLGLLVSGVELCLFSLE